MDPTEKMEFNYKLARYFESKSLYHGEQSYNNPNIRKLAELPWQLTKAKMWKELLEVLNSYEFVEAKIKGFEIQKVQEDYDFSLINNPGENQEKFILNTWALFLRDKKHLFQKGDFEWPAYKIFLQAVFEQAENSPVYQCIEKYLKNTNIDWTWIMPTIRPSNTTRTLSKFTVDSFSYNPLETFRSDFTVSGNSHYILSSIADNEIIIIDIKSEEVIYRRKFNCDIIKAVFINSDDLIIAEEGGLIKIGNVSDPGSFKLLTKTGTNDIRGISFSMDGSNAFIRKNGVDLHDLILRNENFDIDVFDLSKAKIIASLRGHADGVDIMLQIDNNTLVTASGGVMDIEKTSILGMGKFQFPKNIRSRTQAIIVWNLNSFEEIRVLSGHKYCISSIIHAGHDRLISFSLDRNIFFWNWTSITKPCFASLPTYDVTAIALSNNSSLFVTGSETGKIELYLLNDKTSACIGSHNEVIRQIQITNDNSYIISISDTKIKIWEIEKILSAIRNKEFFEEIQFENDFIESDYTRLKILFDPDGRENKKIKVYSDANNSMQIRQHDSDTTLDLPPRVMCFYIDLSMEFTMVLENLQKRFGGILTEKNGQKVFEFNPESIFKFTPILQIEDKNIFVYVIEFTVVIYNYSEKSFLTLNYSDRVTSIANFQDTLILGLISGDIAFVELPVIKKSNPVILFKSHLGAITDLKVNTFHEFLISASIDGTVKVWDFKHRILKYTFIGHTDMILSLALTFDNKLLSGSADNSIIYWNLQNGKKIKKFTGHCDNVLSLCVHPEGNIFFSASKDGELRKWYFNSADSSVLITKMSNPILKLKIATDSRKLLAFSVEQVKIFELTSLHELFSVNSNSVELKTKSQGKDETNLKLKPVKVYHLGDNFNQYSSRKQYTLKGNGKVNTTFLNASFDFDQKYLISISSSNIIELRDLNTGILKARFFSHHTITDCFISFENQILVALGKISILKYLIINPNNLPENTGGSFDAKVKWEQVETKKNVNVQFKPIESNQIINTLIDFLSEKNLISMSKKECDDNLKIVQSFKQTQINNSVLFNNYFTLVDPKSFPNIHPSAKTQLENQAKLLIYSFINVIDEYKLLLFNSLRTNQEDLMVTIYSIINELIVLNKVVEGKLWAQESSGNLLTVGPELVEVIEEWLRNYGVCLDYNQWIYGPSLGANECLSTWWQTGQITRIESGHCMGLYKYQNKLVLPGIKAIIRILGLEEKKDSNNSKTNNLILGTEFDHEQKYLSLFDDAEKAFKEQKWEVAYNNYLKLVQQGKFDPDYLRYNIAICRINGMAIADQKIVSDVEYIVSLLRNNGAEEKAQSISDKLKLRVDILNAEELLLKNSKKPWWKRLN